MSLKSKDGHFRNVGDLPGIRRLADRDYRSSLICGFLHGRRSHRSKNRRSHPSKPKNSAGLRGLRIGTAVAQALVPEERST